MGVFNRLGSISKLPIMYNDEVYCYIGIRTNIDTYGNPFAHLIPIHFPIIGRYDDYGSIMDIEESEITKNLCKLFQCNDIEALFKEVYKNETFQDNIFNNKKTIIHCNIITSHKIIKPIVPISYSFINISIYANNRSIFVSKLSYILLIFQ